MLALLIKRKPVAHIRTFFDGFQKIICCLTAGEILTTGEHPTTKHAIVGHETMKNALEGVKYYDRKGRGLQAFDYDNEVKDELRDFYAAAIQDS